MVVPFCQRLQFLASWRLPETIRHQTRTQAAQSENSFPTVQVGCVSVVSAPRNGSCQACDSPEKKPNAHSRCSQAKTTPIATDDAIALTACGCGRDLTQWLRRYGIYGICCVRRFRPPKRQVASYSELPPQVKQLYSIASGTAVGQSCPAQCSPDSPPYSAPPRCRLPVDR